MLKTKDLMARERAILTGLRSFVLELPGYWRTFRVPAPGRKASAWWRTLPDYLKFVGAQTVAVINCGWHGHVWVDVGELGPDSGVIETICCMCGEAGPRQVLW